MKRSGEEGRASVEAVSQNLRSFLINLRGSSPGEGMRAS